LFSSRLKSCDFKKPQTGYKFLLPAFQARTSARNNNVLHAMGSVVTP